MAPDAGTPEAPAGLQEAVPGRLSQSSALGASHPDVSPTPRADPRIAGLGRFRIDFKAFRKRKEASGGNARPCRPL